jgi:hypothetical protein
MDRTCNYNYGNEQSSIKSASAIIPVSFASGISDIIFSITSTEYLLNSYDASHLSVCDKKFKIAFHFLIFYLTNARTLLNTSILNSSLISDRYSYI